MLHYTATLCLATARLMPRSPWRFAALLANNSSTVATSNSATSVKEDDSAKLSEVQSNILQKENQKETRINETNFHPSKKISFNANDVFSKQFEAAKSINDLLDLATIPALSTNDALTLISHITKQINSGKAEIVDVEADERFIHLRKIVKTNDNIKFGTKKLSNDLSQYSKLSTPAMISVMASLRDQGKRNTPLLRMLSYNIVKYNMKLNLKQCASLLYSMAVLNFPDKVLLEKIMNDLLICIPNTDMCINSVTSKSILTSLGFLFYKNVDVLDAFCDAVFNESVYYKTHDCLSILQTFAALQYKPKKINLFLEKFIEYAKKGKTADWLDVVWCLAVLDVVQPQYIKSVLEPTFVDKLFGFSKINVSKILKLMNINAVAQFVLKNYEGPILNTNSKMFTNLSLIRAKEKQMYISTLSDTLSKVLPSEAYFKTDIDTNMGFLLDAEYRIDTDHKLIKVENWDEQSENIKRIGIMIHDYHDYCRGQNDLKGSTYLYTQLLKAKGYHLITISYKNFSAQDKIEKRTYYLRECMGNVYNMNI